MDSAALCRRSITVTHRHSGTMRRECLLSLVCACSRSGVKCSRSASGSIASHLLHNRRRRHLLHHFRLRSKSGWLGFSETPSVDLSLDHSFGPATGWRRGLHSTGLHSIGPHSNGNGLHGNVWIRGRAAFKGQQARFNIGDVHWVCPWMEALWFPWKGNGLHGNVWIRGRGIIRWAASAIQHWGRAGGGSGLDDRFWGIGAR